MPKLDSAVVVTILALTSAATAEEPPDGGWHSPAPGRSRLVIAADIGTLDVQARFADGKQAATVSCSTPCNLWLPPGRVELRYGTPETSTDTQTITLDEGGIDLFLSPPQPPPPSRIKAPPVRPAAPAPKRLGQILTDVGATLGSIGLAMTLSSAAYLGTQQHLYGDVHDDVYIMLGVGPVLAVGGLVMLIVGRTR